VKVAEKERKEKELSLAKKQAKLLESDRKRVKHLETERVDKLREKSEKSVKEPVTKERYKGAAASKGAVATAGDAALDAGDSGTAAANGPASRPASVASVRPTKSAAGLKKEETPKTE
jgi:hypothetical protein